MRFEGEGGEGMDSAIMIPERFVGSLQNFLRPQNLIIKIILEIFIIFYI